MANYGVIAIIIALMISGAAGLFYREKLTAAARLTASYILLILFFLAQISLVYHYSDHRPSRARYLNNFLNINLIDIPSSVLRILDHHLSNLTTNNWLIPLLFVSSLLGLLIMKRFIWPAATLLSLAGLGLLSNLGLFPASIDRHTVSFSVIPLFTICLFVGELAKSKQSYKKVASFIVTSGLIIGLYSNDLLRPSAIHSKTDNFWVVGPTKSDLITTANMINKQYNLPAFVLTTNRTESMLRENFKVLKADYSSRIKIVCYSKNHPLMSDKSFRDCLSKLSEIYQQDLSNKVLLLPYVNFNPQKLSLQEFDIIDSRLTDWSNTYSAALKLRKID